MAWSFLAGNYGLRPAEGSEELEVLASRRPSASGQENAIVATANSTITPVSGLVEQVNDSGFKLSDGTWLNYSRYDYQGPAKGQPGPAVGQTIQATVKGGKYLVTLAIGGTASVPVAAPAAPQVTPPNVPTPVAQAPASTNSAATMALFAAETRQTLLKTLAVAQPGMFADLDNLQILTEIIRNLEQFVLEDLIAANTPDIESDPEADDLLEEDGDI